MYLAPAGLRSHNLTAALWTLSLMVFSVFRFRRAREAYLAWITPGGAAVYSQAFISSLRQAPWLRAAAAGFQSSSLTPRKSYTLWYVHTSRSLGSSWRSGVFPTAKVAIAYSIQGVTSTFCTVRVCSRTPSTEWTTCVVLSKEIRESGIPHRRGRDAKI